MGKLTQVSVLGLLKPVIKDQKISRSLTKCIIKIFDTSPQDPGVEDPVESLVDRIIEQCQEIEVPGLRDTSIGMLREKQFHAFARVLRMLRDLFEYPEARLINYTKNLKFQMKLTGGTISPWIDVRQTAEAIREDLNPSRLRIFAGLNLEERYLLQGFTSEQIDVMSKVGPKGIDIFSRINHVLPYEKAMILGLKLTESWLFKDIGFRKIRLLSKLNDRERNRFLTLGQTDRLEMSIDSKRRTRFLEQHSIDTPERQDLLYALAFMETEDLHELRELISREGMVLKIMSEAAGELAERTSTLTDNERNEYSHLTPKQLNVLRNLNSEHSDAVKKFDNLKEVLDVANNLSSDQRDLILSLRGKEIQVLCGNEIGDKLSQAGRIALYSREIIQNFQPLSMEEKIAILKLNQEERSVLAKAYILGNDGLLLIRELGPELTTQVVRGDKNLTVMQKALKKKLDSVIMDEVELTQLFKVMKHEANDVLLGLSWKGIKLLTRLADLDERMIKSVEKLSDDWMELLIANDKLTGEGILMIQNLEESERKVLINLNLDQREFLSNKLDSTELLPDLFNQEQCTVIRNLDTEGSDVLRRIILLSTNEQRLFKGLKNVETTPLSTMDPVELNLFATLSFDELRLLSSFLVWHSGEDLAFKFLGMETRTSFDERIEDTRAYLDSIPKSLSMTDQHNHFSIVAATIESLRIDGSIKDDYVSMIPELIKEVPEWTSQSLIFTLHLLKFSLRDSESLTGLLLPNIVGTNDELFTVSRIDQIRTIEDLMFVKWILSQPSTLNDGTLFKLARGNLMRLSFHPINDHEIDVVLSETDEISRARISQNLRLMLMADEYLLAAYFFFEIGKRGSSIKFITDTFHPDDCFQFLKTPALAALVGRIRTLRDPDLFLDTRFPEPSMFDISIYYNRGNVVALAEKLAQDQLYVLLERRPLPLLAMMTRNLQIGLIKLYENVEQVGQLVAAHRKEFFGNLIQHLRQHVIDFSSEMFFNMGRVIRILAYWKSFVGNDIYKNMISEYINCLGGHVSDRVMRSLLNHFVSDEVNLEELLRSESLISLRDGAGEGCIGQRKKRDAGIKCVDSRNTEEITSEVTQRVMTGTIDETQYQVYDELLEYSKARFVGERVDHRVQEALISKIKKYPLESLDPRIKDIVETLRSPQLFDSKLKQSGTFEKLETVTSCAGSIFTLFIVGKHIAHGDIKSLAYDVLYIGVLPKLGEQITNLSEEHIPILGTAIGRAVSNFAAYLGLIESIITRTNAVDELDEEKADVDIVSSVGLIALDLTAVATRILGGFGTEVAVLGALNGPVGAALTTSIVVGSYLVDVALEMRKVTKYVQLSPWEEVKLYWDLFRDEPVPERLKIDKVAKILYTEYISNQLKRFRNAYDNIAISLPSFFVTQTEFVTMDFSRGVIARYPFSTNQQPSKLFPVTLEGYDLVCGPSAKDAHRDTEALYIPQNRDDDCANIVSFRKPGTSISSRMFFHVMSNVSMELSNDDSFDIVFHGSDITIEDRPSPGPIHNESVNRYYFRNQPRKCSIHKKGENIFHVEAGRFECDLGTGTEEQHNTVIVDRDFVDSIGIHTIVGSKDREIIEANFAEFVDGNGGGDMIRATESTIVKGYANDFITGNCTVMLPFGVNEIARFLAHVRIIVYDREGSWIGVDRNARITTADNFLLTPIRISNRTHRLIRAHIKKSVGHRIFIEQELPLLRNLTIPRCKLVKQITSANYDIVLSESGKTVFRMDKNAHWYHWEAAEDPGNLYIFSKSFAEVTIANANGILDFKELKVNPIFDKAVYHWSSEGGFEVSVGGLQVNLLPKYRNVRITFDGKEYFKLGKSGMCRDWCSHSLPIVGRVFIDGSDLGDHYNCFGFRSGKVIFLRTEHDLVIVSNKGILTIGKYYSHLHGEIELSLELKGGRIIESSGFRVRAEHPYKLIYYEIGDSGLQIYHNQPVDEHHIGLVDLKNKSIGDIEMMMDQDRLLLSYRNSILVRFENWANYEPARVIMFAFEDSFLPNAECVLSICDPDDIVEEFDIAKRKSLVANTASQGFSWINGLVNAIVNPIRNYYAMLDFASHEPYVNKFGADFCLVGNVNLGFLLLQTYLDRRFPIPKPRSIPMVETLADIIEFIEEFEGNDDSFELYTDIAKQIIAS